MAAPQIIIGAAANDGSSDTIRIAFGKINTAFATLPNPASLSQPFCAPMAINADRDRNRLKAKPWLLNPLRVTPRRAPSGGNALYDAEVISLATPKTRR